MGLFFWGNPAWIISLHVINVNNGNPNARTRALTPRVNACGCVLTVKSACSATAVVTSNKVRTEQTITENSVRRLIQRLRSIGTASSRTRKIRER